MPFSAAQVMRPSRCASCGWQTPSTSFLGHVLYLVLVHFRSSELWARPWQQTLAGARERSMPSAGWFEKVVDLKSNAITSDLSRQLWRDSCGSPPPELYRSLLA